MSTRTEVFARTAAEERARLSEAFDALEREVDELTDWRAYVRREPLIPAGIAVAAGVACGMMTKPARNAGRRQLPSAGRARQRTKQAPNSSLPATLWSRTSSALLEMLAARAVGLLLGRLRR